MEPCNSIFHALWKVKIQYKVCPKLYEKHQKFCILDICCKSWVWLNLDEGVFNQQGFTQRQRQSQSQSQSQTQRQAKFKDKFKDKLKDKLKDKDKDKDKDILKDKDKD